MSAIEFKYRRESGPFGPVQRPVAGVLLENGSRRLEALMYIDSGADITTIPLGAGSALGFIKNARDPILEMRGVSGGGVPYLVKSAQLGLDGSSVKTRLAWALIEEVPFLLGRLDVFNRFDITFRERDGTILFEPIPPESGHRPRSTRAR